MTDVKAEAKAVEGAKQVSWFEPTLKDLNTLKFLIEEHARLDFSDFLSTLLEIFHVMNKKIPPCSFINLLNKKAGTSE